MIEEIKSIFFFLADKVIFLVFKYIDQNSFTRGQVCDFSFDENLQRLWIVSR